METALLIISILLIIIVLLSVFLLAHSLRSFADLQKDSSKAFAFFLMGMSPDGEVKNRIKFIEK